MNKLDKAVNEIQKLIDKYPDEVRYYNFKAEIYLANKMVDKALEVYNKILQIAPDDPHVNISPLQNVTGSKAIKKNHFRSLKLLFITISSALILKFLSCCCLFYRYRFISRT